MSTVYINSKRASALSSLTRAQLAADDLLVVADISVPETKKIQVSEFQQYILNGSVLTGSITTASYASTVETASYALKAETVETASYALRSFSSSHAIQADTASFVTASNLVGVVVSASHAESASWAETCSLAIASNAINSTFADTASYLLYVPGRPNGTAFNAISSSYADRTPTASFLVYGGSERSNGTASYAATASTAVTARQVFNAYKDFGIFSAVDYTTKTGSIARVTLDSEYYNGTKNRDLIIYAYGDYSSPILTPDAGYGVTQPSMSLQFQRIYPVAGNSTVIDTSFFRSEISGSDLTGSLTSSFHVRGSVNGVVTGSYRIFVESSNGLQIENTTRITKFGISYKGDSVGTW